MSFDIRLAFGTAHERDDFAERSLPRVRGQRVESAEDDAEGQMPSLRVSVGSPSAARDVCHQVVSFLAHSKGSRISVYWTGADQSEQSGEIGTGGARDAEIVALRLGAAAKAALDGE
jgi:hypothetical protein